MCLFVQVFQGAHYAGGELCPSFEEEEAWQKVFGPVFIYLNSAPIGTPCPALWQNAKAQVSVHSSTCHFELTTFRWVLVLILINQSTPGIYPVLQFHYVDQLNVNCMKINCAAGNDRRDGMALLLACFNCLSESS